MGWAREGAAIEQAEHVGGRHTAGLTARGGPSYAPSHPGPRGHRHQPPLLPDGGDQGFALATRLPQQSQRRHHPRTGQADIIGADPTFAGFLRRQLPECQNNCIAGDMPTSQSQHFFLPPQAVGYVALIETMKEQHWVSSVLYLGGPVSSQSCSFFAAE